MRRTTATLPTEYQRLELMIQPAIIERLRGIVVENKDASEVMSQHDSIETLHYVDPPYLLETRSAAMHRNGCYVHELEPEDHARLLAYLQTLTGMVIVSGYPHPSYEEALAGWERIEVNAHADGALDRVEVLWLNPFASSERVRLISQRGLFS